MKNIDQLLIKISGKAYIEQKLELGQDVHIVVQGAVVKEETSDNQDGSVNIVYVVKPETVEIGLARRQAPAGDDDYRVDAPQEQEEVDIKDIPF